MRVADLEREVAWADRSPVVWLPLGYPRSC